MNELPSIEEQRMVWAEIVQDIRAISQRVVSNGHTLTDRQSYWVMRSKFWTFFDQSNLQFLEPWPPDWDQRSVDVYMPNYFSGNPRSRQHFPATPSTNTGQGLRKRLTDLINRAKPSKSVGKQDHIEPQTNHLTSNVAVSNNTQDPFSFRMSADRQESISGRQSLPSYPQPTHMERSLHHGPGKPVPPISSSRDYVTPEYPAMAVLNNRANRAVLRAQRLSHTSQNLPGQQRNVSANITLETPNNHLATEFRSRTPIRNFSRPHTPSVIETHASRPTTDDTLHFTRNQTPDLLKRQDEKENREKIQGGNAKHGTLSKSSSQWPLSSLPLSPVEETELTSRDLTPTRSPFRRPDSRPDSPYLCSVPNFSKPLPALPKATTNNFTMDITEAHCISPTEDLSCKYCCRSGHTFEQCRACTYCAGKGKMPPDHELFECPMYEIFEPVAFSDAFYAHMLRRDFVPPEPSHGTRLKASVNYGIERSS